MEQGKQGEQGNKVTRENNGNRKNKGKRGTGRNMGTRAKGEQEKKENNIIKGKREIRLKRKTRGTEGKEK